MGSPQISLIQWDSGFLSLSAFTIPFQSPTDISMLLIKHTDGCYGKTICLIAIILCSLALFSGPQSFPQHQFCLALLD
jgi:hypothetical protein